MFILTNALHLIMNSSGLEKYGKTITFSREMNLSTSRVSIITNSFQM